MVTQNSRSRRKLPVANISTAPILRAGSGCGTQKGIDFWEGSLRTEKPEKPDWVAQRPSKDQKKITESRSFEHGN